MRTADLEHSLASGIHKAAFFAVPDGTVVPGLTVSLRHDAVCVCLESGACFTEPTDGTIDSLKRASRTLVDRLVLAVIGPDHVGGLHDGEPAEALL